MSASPGRKEEAASLPLFRPRWSTTPRGIQAGVSTCEGGVSPPPFHSLNLLFSTDDPRNVVANRQRLAAAAGYAAERAVLPFLQHGVRVHSVDRQHAGAGALTPPAPLPGDALVSRESGLPLLVTSADCAPVFLADVEGEAIGIAHAGWRGAAAGIVRSTVTALRGLLPPSRRLVAALGPSIGPCCFEVGDEVAARFDADFVHARATRSFVDLFASLRAQLLAEGVELGSERPPCTACDPRSRFFSHRAAGGRPTGRMAAFIFRTPTPSR